jgi:hypothetical protein
MCLARDLHFERSELRIHIDLSWEAVGTGYEQKQDRSYTIQRIPNLCLSTLKHGDEHSKQAISDTTQGATGVMTDLAQARVVMFAARIVLDTGASATIERVA